MRISLAIVASSMRRRLWSKCIHLAKLSLKAFLLRLRRSLGFFALRISLINQDGGLDAWLYTGYGQEFKTLQELFGWTYYAVRFPVILLDLAVPKSLDPCHRLCNRPLRDLPFLRNTSVSMGAPNFGMLFMLSRRFCF